MAGAAPAFSYNYPERVPDRPQRPRVRVVPGQKPRTNVQTVPSNVVTLAKAAAVVLVLVSLLCCARIAIASATVSTSIQSQQISNQIDSARSGGSNLEVKQSSLSNPTRVKNEATNLKMAAADSSATIDLGVDVVATDDAGNLSLSRSMQSAAEAVE